MDTRDILMDTSVLYRYTQKYYDKCLEEYDINFSQLPILILIYEHEGITMNHLAYSGGYDKGTITKSIQKLMQSGHVQMASDEVDKRVKRLYTTDQTRQMIAQLYMVRRDWWEHLTQSLSEEEIALFASLQEKMCESARGYADVKRDVLKLFGIQKVSVLDYPGKVASTLFTGGCNFRCPFCHNSDLVYLSENTSELSMDNIMDYLKKRSNVLDGVCISGGEPLMHELKPFIWKLKNLGYQVKLDTNGSYPDKLKELVEEGLIDYVAMDVKNGKRRYGETVGIDSFDFTPIQESITYLKNSEVPHEFRTTLVEEFHGEKEIKEIKSLLAGAKCLVLQKFEDKETVIQTGLHPVSDEMMKAYQQELAEAIETVELRGL